MPLQPAPINHPRTADTDALATLGKDKGLLHIHVGIHHRATLGDVVGIVCEIGAAQQAGTGGYLQHHARFQINRAANVIALGKQHYAPASRTGCNRPVNGCGIDAHAVSDRAEIIHAKNFVRHNPRFKRGGEFVCHTVQVGM
jgi:hypothetical protein